MRVLACAAFVLASGCALVACALFPSLGALRGGADAGPEADGSPADAGADACADPSLVLGYTFDEGQGLVAHDCSGHGNDGMLMSKSATPWTSAGHAGGAINFSVADATCVVAPHAVELTGDFTVSAWVNGPSTASSQYIVGHRFTNTSVEWRLSRELGTGSSTHLELDVGCTAGGCLASSTNLSEGVWHHVAGVYSPGKTQVAYLDGQPFAAATPAPMILVDATATLTVGCRSDKSTFFTGVIDQVFVYARALSPDEIAALAAQ